MVLDVLLLLGWLGIGIGAGLVVWWLRAQDQRSTRLDARVKRLERREIERAGSPPFPADWRLVPEVALAQLQTGELTLDDIYAAAARQAQTDAGGHATQRLEGDAPWTQ